jgi:hypothetical protein
MFVLMYASYVAVRAMYFSGVLASGSRCSGLASNPHCGVAALPRELIAEAPFYGVILAGFAGFLFVLGSAGKAGRMLQVLFGFLGLSFVWIVGLGFAAFG